MSRGASLALYTNEQCDIQKERLRRELTSESLWDHTFSRPELTIKRSPSVESVINFRKYEARRTSLLKAIPASLVLSELRGEREITGAELGKLKKMRETMRSSFPELPDADGYTATRHAAERHAQPPRSPEGGGAIASPLSTGGSHQQRWNVNNTWYHHGEMGPAHAHVRRKMASEFDRAFHEEDDESLPRLPRVSTAARAPSRGFGGFYGGNHGRGSMPRSPPPSMPKQYRRLGMHQAQMSSF